MSFVLGFGSTEEAFEKTEQEAFKGFVESAYVERGLEYFTDEFVGDVARWINRRSADFQRQAKANDSKVIGSDDPPPSRYGYYHAHVVADASYIVAILKFSHINRRHALSPDGWAFLQTERLVSISSVDLDMRNRERVA